MATELIASGTTAASSADITLADGEATTIIMRGDGYAEIQAKASDATYHSIGELGTNDRALTVLGPLVFRVHRPAGVAAGFDQE